MSNTMNNDVDSTTSLVAGVIAITGAAIYLVTLPVVMGNFADALSLDEAQLGAIMAVYMLGFTIASISGYWWIRKRDWRKATALFALTGAIVFLAATLRADYETLLFAHLVAGIAAGAVYSIAFALLCDRKLTGRALAIGYGCQGMTGFIVASVMPTGPDQYATTLVILAGGLLASLAVSKWLPKRGSKLGVASVQVDDSKPTVPVWVVFAGFGVVMIPYMSEVSGVTFLSEIAIDKGLSREAGQMAAAWSQLASFGGSMLAVLIGMRFGRIAPLAVATVISLLATSMFIMYDEKGIYIAAAVLMMGTFGFSVPYRMALAADADTSGRFTTWSVSAQTIAGVIGPGVAGVIIVGSSYMALYKTWIALYLIGIALYVIGCRRLQRATGEE